MEMKCKCGKMMEKELTLEYLIYRCPCGEVKVTDYAGREVDTKTRMLITEIYDG
jgi:hypothetical protein